MSEIAKPKNPEDDWKVWLVVNPGTWLIPILMAVLVVALAVHAYVLNLPKYTWAKAAAPAPVAAAPARAAPAAPAR
jgi:light-harvesting complex 1 alpha chain